MTPDDFLPVEPDYEHLWAQRQELRSADVDRREWAGDEYAERLAYGLMRG
jgi:hypothetical protein